MTPDKPVAPHHDPMYAADVVAVLARAAVTAVAVPAREAVLPDGKVGVVPSVHKTLLAHLGNIPEAAALDAGHPETGAFLSAAVVDRIVNGPAAPEATRQLLETVRPRTLKDPAARERARRIKTPCPISLRSIHVIGENGYYNYPETVAPFLRHAAHDPDEYARLDVVSKDFHKASLPELSAAIGRIIAMMRSSDSDDTWLGFHRIRPVVAAATLARMHRYEWSDILHLTVSPVRLPVVSTKVGKETVAKALEVIRKGPPKFMARDVAAMNFQYSPRLHPLHSFRTLPRAAAEIVAMAEAMPEFGSRPGFDYYWVLIPGVSLDHPSTRSPDGFFRVMIGDEEVASKSEFEVAVKLDTHLVATGCVTPCILGERDGRCYFLGLFA